MEPRTLSEALHSVLFRDGRASSQRALHAPCLSDVPDK